MAHSQDPLKVIWSDLALSDLDAIEDYVALVAPTAARRLSMRLVAATESLAQNPERGRPVNGALRELVSVKPYAIRYFVEPAAVRIVRIRHMARRPA